MEPNQQPTYTVPGMAEFMAALDASRKESEKRMAEWERERKRDNAEWERKNAELNKQMGFLSNRLGEVMEALASVSVRRQLKKRGHAITTVNDKVKILSATGETMVEIDVVLFNGGTVFLAETKTKLTSQMVDKHIARIETVAAHPQPYTHGKKIAGIVAAAVLPDAVANYAMKKGLLVVRPDNDVFSIINPEDFVLKTW